MRTSIILDDELAEQMRARAKAKGLSLSAFLAEAGRAALRQEESPEARPFELITHGRGGTYAGVDLDRTGDLLAAEDEHRYGR